MSRRQQVNCPLNTINLSYSRQPRSQPQHTRAQAPRRAINNAEDLPEQDPKTLKLSESGSHDKCDTVFSDSNLKKETSQSGKEACFSRLRVHLHRREKQPKWLELVASQNIEPCRVRIQLRQGRGQVQGQGQGQGKGQRRENKTALSRRRLVDPADSPQKVRTDSSERERRCRSGERKNRANSTLQMESDQQPRGNEESRWQRMDELVGSKPPRYILNDSPKVCRNKGSRYLSENAAQITQRLDKLEANRQGRKGGKLAREDGEGRKGDEVAGGEFIFEAWEDVDIFSTNKNGIIEYTKQQTDQPQAWSMCGGK